MSDPSESLPEYGVLVHCHLRWDFVWQRPQHIMSRLSKFHPVLFLEDALSLPEGGGDRPRMEITRVSDTLTVARPLLRAFTGDVARDAGIEKENTETFLRLLETTYRELGWERMVHWFYTPMA